MVDSILLILLVFCIIRGYRAGFFQGIKKVASLLVGFFIAGHFTQPFSQFLVAHTQVEAGIFHWLEEKIAGLSFAPQALPQPLKEQITRLLPADLASHGNAVEWLTQLLLASLSFALLFILTVAIFRLLINLINELSDQLSLSHLVNHAAGAALYAGQFLLLLIALVYVVRPLLLTGEFAHIPALLSLQQAVDNSAILSSITGALQTLGWL